MKNIYINPLFYVVSLIMLVTGFFKPFLYMLIYLVFHEAGHIIVGTLFGYRVFKINVFPCGLLTIFDMKLNDSIFKDFLIAVSGPLFQMIGYLIFKKYYFIHFFLLVFNLLPIYPLDGSKILCDVLFLIFPFKKCNDFLFMISYIICLFFIFYFCLNFNLFYLIIFIVLFLKVIEFYKIRYYLFNSFILERILYDFKFYSFKRIDCVDDMYKGFYHYILDNGSYVLEDFYFKKNLP